MTDYRYVETLTNIGARFVCYADECASSIKHIGWYSDDDEWGYTFRGAVLQIPGTKGQARFIAAYQDSANDGFVVDTTRVISETADRWTRPSELDAARDIAYRADTMAKIAAEEAREHARAWRMGSDYSEEAKLIVQLRTEALRVLRSRRAVKSKSGTIGPDDYQTLCGVITDKITSIRTEIQEARARMAEARDSVYPCQYSTFNEGAGRPVFQS